MFKNTIFFIATALLFNFTPSEAQNLPSDETVVNSTSIINQEPLQENITHFIVMQNERYTITALAKYDITARILHVNDYTDSKADIAPRDFALGWKNMSDTRFLSNIELKQHDRFLFWKVGSIARPIIQAIITQTSNNHLIPSNDKIRQTLMNANVGESINIKGYLVNVRRIDNFRWNTSLVRTDTGDGACEIIYVTEATINKGNDIFSKNLTAKN